MSFVRTTPLKVALLGMASMLLLVLWIPLSTDASTGEDVVIDTIAGPTVVFVDHDGSSNTEDLRPAGLALDRKTGDLYIASIQKNRVLMRDADTGRLSLVAGTGEAGFEGDNGPAVSAKLFIPRALAFTRAILFIADRNNNRVRVVNLTGHTVKVAGVQIKAGNIDTVAGNSARFWNGGEGSVPALSAAIRPNGLAIDDEGNLFIGLGESRRILFMNLQKMPVPLPGKPGRLLDPGHVASVVGNGLITNDPNQPGFDSDRTVVPLGDGGPAHEASFSLVPNVDLDQDGTHLLFLADRDTHRVRVANLTGHTVKVAGVVIEAGNIDTVAGNGSRTNHPGKPGFDSGLAVALLGDGGPATTASLVGPTDVSVDGDGNIFITDSQDQRGSDFAQPRIRRVDGKTGIITTIAGNGVVTGSIDGEGRNPHDDLGDGGPPTKATFTGRNFNILLDKQDRVLIADNGARRVRRVF